MKTLVLISVAAIFICLVNSATHSHHHRGRMLKTSDSGPEDGSDSDWPIPGNISDFGVPDAFTGGPDDDGHGPDDGGTEAPPRRHHGKSHHKSHKP